MRCRLFRCAVVVAAAAVASTGCVGEGPTPVDGGDDVVAVSDFDVELGTGRTVFRPLTAGDDLLLERGFQGLQHVLVGVRTTALTPGRYVVTPELARVRDDVVVSEPTSIRVPLTDGDESGAATFVGMQLVIGEPDGVVGEDCVLHLSVEDDDLGLGFDVVEVHVEWAPDGWNPDVE